MREHIQAVGKEPSTGHTRVGMCRHLCSKPACGTQTTMDHPKVQGALRPSIHPKIHSAPPASVPALQCLRPPALAAAVPASWLLSSPLEQPQQPGRIKMHQGNSTSVLGLCQQGSGLECILLPVRMGEQ